MNSFKPNNYNSLSPYLIADDAQKLVDLLTELFHAETLRRFDREDGKIGHIELLLDDSVLMISNSTEQYKANTTMMHMYVENVQATFDKAISLGCTIIDLPTRQEGDSDIRGSFYDFAENYWSIGSQTE